jgi:hypothetical protein
MRDQNLVYDPNLIYDQYPIKVIYDLNLINDQKLVVITPPLLMLQMIDLKPLEDAKLKELNLEGKDACWCGAYVDVPATAATVDFVFSDRELRTWDNNSNTDYHSKVYDAASKDSMVEMVYQVGGEGG